MFSPNQLFIGCLVASLLSHSLSFAGPPAEPGNYQIHAALEISLFAREPDVVDPVGLTWDEDGRMYVVEMRDYPYGFGPQRKPGGTIRLLEDTDGDGKADRSRLFADQLSFPTSIARWNGGVLVTAPPEVVFLKDTNGDGRADVREVMLKGFQLGVTDGNVNGLRWGLDNRLHGANGGNGGAVVSVRKPGPPISLRNCDFSFDPASGEFTLTHHTSGGFGLVFDEWGRSFGTYNINHLQQPRILVRYLARFPGFPPVHAMESISDHEAMSRIYPISEPETRPNHPEQSGHFSSAGGLGYVGWRGYPGDLFGSVLVCDVVGNLVHRDVISLRGPDFVASRSPAELKSEFFSSRDKAFRPVGIESGPDGALYLIDMQRDVIEHPDYIPEKLRGKINIRAGEDRGRIYRITPKSGLSARKPFPGRASDTDLVDYLRDPNPWWRATAQRLLNERNAKGTRQSLEKLSVGKDPLGRLHALWTLEGLGILDESQVLRALADEQKEIRENALLLAERHLPGSAKFQQKILSLAGDADARVRFQAALTTGQLNRPDVQSALLSILRRDYSHRWTRLAVLSSLGSGEAELFVSLFDDQSFWSEITAAKLDLMRELCDLIGARATAKGLGLSAVLAKVADASSSTKLKVAAVEGLVSGLARAGKGISADEAGAAALEKLFRTDSAALFVAVWKLSRKLGRAENDLQRTMLEQAKHRVLDGALSLSNRIDNVRILQLGSYSAAGQTLIDLLAGTQPSEIQFAALEALSQFNELDVATNLVSRWRKFGPSVRPLVINLLLQRLSFHPVLLDSIGTDRLKLGELNLDLEQRRRLLRRSSPDVQARAARLIGDEEYSNRKAIVEEWLSKTPAQGDVARGRVVFEKICAQCHVLDKIGHAVGPDLASLAERSVEDLLSNILDPNMAIHADYVAYSVETTTGELETGLLQSESAEAVQLLQANGRQIVIPRDRIKRLESSGLSLMPEGLESGLTPADLRDLIALIQLRR